MSSGWLARLMAPAPMADWSEAYRSEAGLARRHNTRGFLLALYAALEIPRDNKMGRMMWFAKNFRAFEAPVLMLIHTPRYMGPPQWSDMGMWLQSVMLLLVEQGLASCPQECWAMYGETVRKTLGLEDGQILFSGLAIGYADDAKPVNQGPVPRVGIDEAIEWQGF